MLFVVMDIIRVNTCVCAWWLIIMMCKQGSLYHGLFVFQRVLRDLIDKNQYSWYYSFKWKVPAILLYVPEDGIFLPIQFSNVSMVIVLFFQNFCK